MKSPLQYSVEGSPADRPAWMSDKSLLPKAPPVRHLEAVRRRVREHRAEALGELEPVRASVTEETAPADRAANKTGPWGQEGAFRVAEIRGVVGLGARPHLSRGARK